MSRLRNRRVEYWAIRSFTLLLKIILDHDTNALVLYSSNPSCDPPTNYKLKVPHVIHVDERMDEEMLQQCIIAKMDWGPKEGKQLPGWGVSSHHQSYVFIYFYLLNRKSRDLGVLF